MQALWWELSVVPFCGEMLTLDQPQPLHQGDCRAYACMYDLHKHICDYLKKLVNYS
jgi:hypothetical protein